ncbi:MAG: hypothetical protein C0406_06420 [Sideroxydans sp.]|nr:hypothetical protein [Sideroxydans sp.]
MLRNVGLLLLMFAGFQLLAFLLMHFTGLQFRAAASLVIAAAIVIVVGSYFWLAFSAIRRKSKVTAAHNRGQKAMSEFKKQIPYFRDAVEKIKDPEAKAQALSDLEWLEKGDNKQAHHGQAK